MKISRLSIAFGLVLSASAAAFAQNDKPKVKPLATPPPVLSGAEIISRASEQVIEVPVTTRTAERPAEKATVTEPGVAELLERIKKLESTQAATYDEKQKRLLLNLDILTRAEQRSESLRKQVFEMIEKENVVKGRLDQLQFESRPEMIERTLQLAGSMKPEEIRENRRKMLAAEIANLNTLLAEIQSTRSNLSANLLKAEQMVEKLRSKLEKDIDDSFLKDDPPGRDPF